MKGIILVVLILLFLTTIPPQKEDDENVVQTLDGKYIRLNEGPKWNWKGILIILAFLIILLIF